MPCCDVSAISYKWVVGHPLYEPYCLYTLETTFSFPFTRKFHCKRLHICFLNYSPFYWFREKDTQMKKQNKTKEKKLTALEHVLIWLYLQGQGCNCYKHTIFKTLSSRRRQSWTPDIFPLIFYPELLAFFILYSILNSWHSSSYILSWNPDILPLILYPEILTFFLLHSILKSCHSSSYILSLTPDILSLIFYPEILTFLLLYSILKSWHSSSYILSWAPDIIPFTFYP